LLHIPDIARKFEEMVVVEPGGQESGYFVEISVVSLL